MLPETSLQMPEAFQMRAKSLMLLSSLSRMDGQGEEVFLHNRHVHLQVAGLAHFH